ncbi:MAG TPA: ribonuclease HII [Bacteroidetes bacterium]|nr:ribonuclease HII [Bacteroidota bacterium]
MLKSYFQKDGIEVGCDEAGRGPLAGPVFAAAVVWPKKLKVPKINDSKLLNEKTRNELRDYIERKAVAFAVQSVEVQQIENINILQASIKAMHLALEDIQLDFDRILVDGNKFNQYRNIQHHTIVKGDSLYLSIAAASILAKTYRDQYMIELHNKHPEYNWKNNKGYGTQEHIKAILEHGLTPHHRRSFCYKLGIKYGKLF